MLRPKAEKDFYAGLLYLALAVAFLWFGRNLRFGTAAEMGPGYFPLVLASLLGLLGIVAVVRSALSEGAAVDRVQWRPLLLITGASLGFGFLITRAGLVVALCYVATMSAAASRESVYDLKSLLVLTGLVVFCVLVFVKGLGVPMPIFGPWFDGVVPASWQR